MQEASNQPQNCGIRGRRAIRVLDDYRNRVLLVERKDGRDERPEVAKILRPEFEPILPGRQHAGSRKLLRTVQRSSGWVPVAEVGTTTDGLSYLIQPHYDGGSLHDRIAMKPTFPSSVTLMASAAAIIGQLASHKLALGTLRPSYFLTHDGQPSVAVAVHGMSTRRFDDGTVQYLAPETADTGPTPAGDVYSLGLILAELVAGRQREPYEEVGDFLSGISALVPAPLVDLLDHALAPTTTNRIANASLLQRALVRLLDDLPDDAAEVLNEPPEDRNIAVAVTTPPPTVDGPAPTPMLPSEGLPPGLEDIRFAEPEPSTMNGARRNEGGAVDTQELAVDGLVAGSAVTTAGSSQGGPLQDLLGPPPGLPDIRYHNGQAASRDVSPRESADAELATMVETLSARGLSHKGDADRLQAPTQDQSDPGRTAGADDDRPEDPGLPQDEDPTGPADSAGDDKLHPGPANPGDEPDGPASYTVLTGDESATSHSKGRHDSVPFAPAGSLDQSGSLRSPVHRAVDHLHHLWQSHRVALTGALAVVSVTGVATVAGILGASNVQSSRQIVSDGVPVSTTMPVEIAYVNNASPYIVEPPQTQPGVTASTAPARRRRVITTVPGRSTTSYADVADPAGPDIKPGDSTTTTSTGDPRFTTTSRIGTTTIDMFNPSTTRSPDISTTTTISERTTTVQATTTTGGGKGNGKGKRPKPPGGG